MGGDFHTISFLEEKKTKELYDNCVQHKRLIYSIGDRTIKIVPAYIALVETKEDFVSTKAIQAEDDPEGLVAEFLLAVF